MTGLLLKLSILQRRLLRLNPYRFTPSADAVKTSSPSGPEPDARVPRV